MIGEERGNGPCERQNGNDEEDKNRGWCELVGHVKYVDEIAEHANDGELKVECQSDPQFSCEGEAARDAGLVPILTVD